MIINEAVSSPVLTSVLSAPSRFKIKASAKAFKILSGFYSEPILAIPRELGANAWDSHVKAGNTKQMFEVHAPNTLEPWFAIRDFGTGLSPEAVDTIYTTYFESTKTADNDSDGCMGLGSKTPFNYTENFTVTSFYNGKKYVYNCYIDEAGAPNIMQMAVTDTTEHNGVEVKFGVKIADISMWVDKVTRAYEPFRYRPVIKGANITYPERKYIYQGKTWGMREHTNRYENRQSYAFMGNYCYPISSTIIRRALYNSNDAKLGNMLEYGSFDFFFNIGDLEVAPNKEQLQYDDTNNTTASAIISAMKVAFDELNASVKKNIEIPKSRWEAMCLHQKYNSYESPFSSLRNIVGEIKISFNNENIDSNNVSNYSLRNTILNGIGGKMDMYAIELRNNKIKVRKIDNIVAVYGKDVLVYHTTHNSLKKSRVLHHLANQNYTDKNFPTIRVFIDSDSNGKQFAAIKNHFGWNNANVFNVESLPKPPPSPRVKKAIGTDEVFQASIKDFSNVENRHPSVNWLRRAGTFNSNETYYYFDFHYTYPVDGNSDISDHVDDVISVLATEKAISSEIVYGINSKNKNLLKVGNWVNILSLFKSTIAANKEKYEQKYYIHNQRNAFTDLCNVYQKLSYHPSIIANIKNDATRNMFSSFVSTYVKVTNDTISRVNPVLMNMAGISPKKHKELPIDLAAFKKMLDTKYFGIVEVMEVYHNKASSLYKVINFIDEKS
jgi:hypothetical protein